MKLQYMILVCLILGNLNVMAADKELVDTEQSTHHLYNTGVARNAFADEQAAMLQLQQDVDTRVTHGDETGLRSLLGKYTNTPLRGIVSDGIERCKNKKGNADKVNVDVSEPDLPKIEQPKKAVNTRPLPLSYPRSDARVIGKWVAGGLIAGVAIVAAIVCYFKWVRPGTISH